MKPVLLFLLAIILSACTWREPNGQAGRIYYEIPDFSPADTLFRVSERPYAMGAPFGYVDQRGDTVIPYGRFALSFTDTLLTLGIVAEQAGADYELIAINQGGERLYEVFEYDNGPDYLQEGLFRIRQNGRIGYADRTGRIVIPPQFGCAYPFSGGRAKVALECTTRPAGEHTEWVSEDWYYIDKSGRAVR